MACGTGGPSPLLRLLQTGTPGSCSHWGEWKEPSTHPEPGGGCRERCEPTTHHPHTMWHQEGSKSQSLEQLQLRAAFSIKAEARYLRLLLKPNVRFNKGDKSMPAAVLHGAACCLQCWWMGPAFCWHSPTNTHRGDAVTPLLVALPAEGWHRVGTEPSDPNRASPAVSPPHADLSPPGPTLRACAVSLACLSPKVRRERA